MDESIDIVLGHGLRNSLRALNMDVFQSEVPVYCSAFIYHANPLSQEHT